MKTYRAKVTRGVLVEEERIIAVDVADDATPEQIKEKIATKALRDKSYDWQETNRIVSDVENIWDEDVEEV